MDKVNKKTLSGSDLKIIAMISMLIDHIAASALSRYIGANGLWTEFETGNSINVICVIYYAMRIIGRLAFPIYIFLLVEGFTYTRNRWKYLGRLVLFAFISEIPFDVALQLSCIYVKNGIIIETDYQNVFFTLAIGMAALMLIDRMKQSVVEPVPRFFLTCLITVTGMAVAYFLKTDYSYEGVLAIVVTNEARIVAEKKHRNLTDSMFWCSFVLTIFNTIEAASFLDILFVKRYNGERGANVKLLFYTFYPVHLLILGIISVILQLGWFNLM